jgi:hypothetical protein
MSTLKDKLGDVYQQVMIGFATFLVGAIWGGMNAGADMVAADIYWPAVVMLSGAMITVLGTTFGTKYGFDRYYDLQLALNEMAEKMDALIDSQNTEEE